MVVYKLSRPSKKDKNVELVIYAKNLHDVFLILEKLPKEIRISTSLEVIPIVHY